MKNDKNTLIKLMESLNPEFKYRIDETMSEIPTDLEKVEDNDVNKQILRASIISESDAINLYEQFAAKATNEDVKKIMLDVAKEEKTHIGEFQSLLTQLDPEHAEELIKGDQEVDDITETMDLEGGNGESFESLFRELIKSFGYEANQLDDMSEDERRKFFDTLDRKWTSKKEKKWLDEE